jgi:selT/selW/selH-like putative selenoprotein
VEAEIKAAHPDVQVKLIRGGGGIFEVKCEGKLIFSKKDTADRRFPHAGEIARLVGRERAC